MSEIAPACSDAVSAPTFLIVRRDNIGDLVCTTPLFRLLRQHYPNARIHVLVNTYNRAVVDGNPDIDAVHTYVKTKHGAGLRSAWERLRLTRRLYRARIDYAILAGSATSKHALKLVRWIRPRHIIGYVDIETWNRTIDMPVHPSSQPEHEVEAVCRLLKPLGIDSPPPPMRVYPSAADIESARHKLREYGYRGGDRLVGVHISTRRPANRWPDEKYIELIRCLQKAHDATVLLLWAPGDSANPRHPGDDPSAAVIKSALPNARLVAYPMGPLEQLMADLSCCDVVVTSDGGAMHIAAALGKPILCFFGETDASHWRPWAVPYVLLQPSSRRAADIGVDEAMAGVARLLRLTVAHTSDVHALWHRHYL